MERREVATLLATIQAYYPQYNPPDKTIAVNAWFDILKEYPKELVENALRAFISTDTTGFAPSIGQLIGKMNLIQSMGELNEMEAWALVSKAIRNSGYHSVEEFEKLPELVQKSVGTPSQLRTWALDQNYNEQVVSSNFIKCYRTETKMKREYMSLPQNIRDSISVASKNSDAGMIAENNRKVIEAQKNKTINEIEQKRDAVPLSKELKEKYSHLFD